jgi:hypothetical protein
MTWRYDSGLVGGVANLDDLPALTAGEQVALGFFCGNQTASLNNQITSCTNPNFGAKRPRIPAEGTADDDRNPPRIAPRHDFDASIGTDNLLHRADGTRVTLRFTVMNLTIGMRFTISSRHLAEPTSSRLDPIQAR